MRKFYLMNEAGARRGLNGEAGIYLANPEGLGVAFLNSFADIKNGFFAGTNSTQSQGTINADLYFVRNAYDSYAELITWAMSAQELRLLYSTGSTEYYRKVRIQQVSKSELSDTGWLRTPIILQCFTPWYKPVPITVQFSNPTEQNYFTWGVSALGAAALAPNTTGGFSAAVNASGHIAAAVVLTFSGTVSDPQITLRGANESIYGRCELSGDYTGTLVLDTSYEDSRIEANGVDVINAVNVSYEPFFRIPVGEECEITISASSLTGTCEAKVYEYYRSV